MGKVHPAITPRLQEFIAAQHVFFVATAPLTADGHVNVSPKGVAGTSLVVDEHTFAYLDLTASGAETIAHLRENGRITVMFCSFEDKPNIVRLHGHGRVLLADDPQYPAWAERFEQGASPAARAVVVVDVARVSDSCGFGVPIMEYRGEREIFPGYMERRGRDGIRAYQAERNAASIDGLPALEVPPA
ncbi:pyridoxamine 5'-phosphate oxidase family protein [Georgenia alba]|uniref:Pyridoxamine 5'-phosphate oxidase family protein n=1 Tax=Georgenia alba TaxID=2233858 RepID=A0ABW2QHV2_9MICO